MTWLLTGGAGYIGSHIACALHATGRDVVVLDDLSTGHPHRLPPTVPLIQASVLDRTAVVQALFRHNITGVIHLAAKKSVSESVAHPRYYHQQNVVGLRRLLDAMRTADITRLVFSSSAAVYGNATTDVIDETTPTTPISPYGATKLTGERIVRRAGIDTGIRWLALRYFNVAGAGAPHLGDTGVTNLIPMAFHALDQGRRPQIFGTDYPTPDGSCVRDYIHVADVADAHVTAAQHLETHHASSVYNIGRGVGVSVKEVLHTVRCTTGHSFEPEVVSRRPGDPPSVVARTAAIETALGWTARRDLHDMVTNAWASWRAHNRPQVA
ncbi:MAG: UDP-glucose 4-epimerase GalE [Pseudonocardiaceae bacterium]